MRLGLDFGTTNSAVALYDGEQFHPLITDPANENPYITPSMLYIDRKGQQTVGAQAIVAYLEGETGHQVRWRQRDAGEIEVTVASLDGDPIDFIQSINVLVDEAANGRLLQSIKAALFNGRYEGTQIFGKFYRIDNLIAMILRFLKEAAERELGQPCESIVLGRPVRFSDNPAADSRAESILLKAAYIAGFKDVVFRLEPVGIAYLHHRNSADRQNILIFDFGGGTLDLTIAAVGDTTPPEILATDGVLVGGNDLDRRIMESLLPFFGAGDDGNLPPDMVDRLLAWQTMPELSQPHYMERIHTLKRTSHDPTPFRALEVLVTRNLGFKLFKEIERVKKQLSLHRSEVLEFRYEDVHIRKTITRRSFERMIDWEIKQVREGVQRVLETAAMTPDQVDFVLRTGGSSLVPAFYHLLTDIFGEEKQQEIDPMISVVGGFAVAAYELEDCYPIEPHQLIHDLTATTEHTYKPHRISIRKRGYTDRDYRVDRIPAALNGLVAIQMANHDFESAADELLRFELTAASRVYVAYEASIRHLPLWLRDFELENMQIEIKDEFALISRVMRVYGKTYPAGEVILGGNQAAGYDGDVIVNYLVLLQPLSDFS